MKRPPGLWILLTAGVLWLKLQDVYGIRATALIFGKSSTSTTTTTELPSGPDGAAAEEGASNNTETTAEDSNSTKSTQPTLTGNPQIDYVWDPNLPKELNGYNLSDYPFYERVPDETIEFKCDGLHDGFYASVPHKCQVYHHCLFGTRYDFLCANYTAFDQKTFICHFVSEVDCVNSKKFWHRNDALYQAETTTTTARPINLALYTTAPPQAADPITPLSATAQGAVAPIPRKPPPGVRRPYPRRRPPVEYYEDDYYYDDEYYDERPRPRKRPRPKPVRPLYEDEEYEEDYVDERYERPRGGGRRRRPYRRPTRRRTKDRRKEEYEDDYEEVEDRFEDEDYKPGRRRKGNDRRKVAEEYDDEEDVNNRRPQSKFSNKRRPADEEDRKDKKSNHQNRRPAREDYEDELPQGDDSRSYERPRKPEKNSGDDSRPIIKPVSGSIYDRPRLAPRINLPVPKNAANKYAYKNLAGGKTTTTTSSTTPAPLEDEEYYEDEYEEPITKRPKFNRRSQNSRESAESKLKSRDRSKEDRDRNKEDNKDRNREDNGGNNREGNRNRNKEDTRETRKPTISPFKNRVRKPETSTEQTTEKMQPRSKYIPKLLRTSTKKPVSNDEYYDYEEEENVRDIVASTKSKTVTAPSSTSTSTTTTTTTTKTTEAPKEKSDPIIRVVKRPIMANRGGHQFTSRGSQTAGLKLDDKPVETVNEQERAEIKEEKKNRGGTQFPSRGSQTAGLRIEDKPVETANEQERAETTEERGERQQIEIDEKPLDKPFKPSPIIVKIPVRKFPPTAEAKEMFNSEQSRPHPDVVQQLTYKDVSRSTQKPKVIENIPEQNPLDLNEYDVTLNDALNPTLPNLPVRGYPTGFGAQDYTYDTYQRPRYVITDAVVSPSNPEYIYQPKPVRQQQQRYETVQNPHRTQYNVGNYNRQKESQSRSHTHVLYPNY